MADIDNFINTISGNLTKISKNLRNMATTIRPNNLMSSKEWRENIIKVPKYSISIDDTSEQQTLILRAINISVYYYYFIPRMIFNIKPNTKIFIKNLKNETILDADITDNFKLLEGHFSRVNLGIIKINIHTFEKDTFNEIDECIIEIKPNNDTEYELLNCRLGAINEVYYYVDTVSATNPNDLRLLTENNFPFQYALKPRYIDRSGNVVSVEQNYIDPTKQLDLPLLLILKPPFHKPYDSIKDEIYFLTFLNPILESQLLGNSLYQYSSDSFAPSLAKLIKPEVKIAINSKSKAFSREGTIDIINTKPSTPSSNITAYDDNSVAPHANIVFTLKNKTKNTGKINTDTRDFSAKLSTQIPVDLANPQILETERRQHPGDAWLSRTEKYFLYPNETMEDILYNRITLVNNWDNLNLENRVNDNWNNLTPISFNLRNGQNTTVIPSESLLSNDKYNQDRFSGLSMNFNFYKIYAFKRGDPQPGANFTNASFIVNNRYMIISQQAYSVGNIFLSPYLNYENVETFDTNTRKKPMIYIYINNTLIMGTLDNVSIDPGVNGGRGYYIIGSRRRYAHQAGAFQYMRIPPERIKNLPYDFPDNKWSNYAQFFIDLDRRNTAISGNYYFTNLVQNPHHIQFFNGWTMGIPIIHFVKTIRIKNPCIYGTQEDLDKINAMMVNNQQPDYTKIQEMNNTNSNMFDTIDCTVKIQKNLNEFDYEKNCSIKFIDDDLGGELSLPDSMEIPE